MAAHCARTSAFAAGLFISPHEEGRKGQEGGRKRGPLEAEHGLGVIKEMNGYRGGDFFSLHFFRDVPSDPQHPSIRSVSLICAAYTGCFSDHNLEISSL